MIHLVIKYCNIFEPLTKMPGTNYYISNNYYDYLLLLFKTIKCWIRYYVVVIMLGIGRDW